MDNAKTAALRLAKGTAVAAMCTLPGMAVLALAVTMTQMEDGTLGALNQLLKAGSVFMGALCAVGRGGRRGFVTGAAVGLAYMLLGYGLFCALDGSVHALGLMGAEALFGALVGAFSGAIAANMRPPRQRNGRKTAGKSALR